MEELLKLARELLAKDPDISPEEMFHRLHTSGYEVIRTTYTVHEVLRTALDDLCRIAVHEYRHPLVKKEALQKALETCGFSPEEAAAAVDAAYPSDRADYAVCLSTDSKRPRTKPDAAYNVGTGDFTAEAWVKPASGGGTLLSRKPTEGGYRNGGFLLVLKPDGVIKLATDDGIGFYEINTVPTALFDGRFHHILGRRVGGTLEIYVDFAKVDAQVRTDRFAGLNINNELGVTVGAVEQQQEPYNYLTGSVGECRLWNRAVAYASGEEWEQTDYVTPGLIGLWSFRGQTGADDSEENNPLDVAGCTFEAWK